MHPAFSVIFFTVVSGLGYGLWVALGWRLLMGRETPASVALVALGLGAALVAAGLCSSLLHLGQPQRAWRAFSQWRTSWLSREGVMALVSFVPALALAWLLWRGGPPVALRAAAFALVAGAVFTTLCTAMIYASLKPIPAWRHEYVPAMYLFLAGLTGGLAFTALRALAGMAIDNDAAVLGSVLAFGVGALKLRYWRDIDKPLPLPRAAALGLPHERGVRVFERPHTEASYLTTEMGFVLARRHSARLRTIALVLLAVVPTLALLVFFVFPQLAPAPLLVAAAASALLGAFVERWLFFAEAKHLVTLYY
jgi:DMSO reductase anchor subunit